MRRWCGGHFKGYIMKKIFCACVLATLWMLGTVCASDAAATDPVLTDQQSQRAVPESSTTTAPVGTQNNLLVADASLSSGQTDSSKPSAGSDSPAPAPKPVELPAYLKNFKPIGLFYLSYVANPTKDTNSFQLKRGYFGADVDVTSYMSGRFVSDVTMDSTGDVKLRAKYMYAKFHWKGNDVITGPYSEFGLSHMPWLDFEEAINGFRMQDTMFLERNSVFNSADIGFLVGSDLGGSLSGDYKSKVENHYAGKYGSWQIGVYNGGGYHAAENNTNKVFEGRLTIRPVPSQLPGLQFTAFGIAGKGNKAVTNGVNPPDWNGFDGMISYQHEYFTFTGQGFFGAGNQGGSVVNSDGTAADQKGYSIFGSVRIPTPKIGGKISLLGRFDQFDTNTHVLNDMKSLYIAGVAWHFNKSNTWLFDYQRTNHSVSTTPGENQVQLTLQLAF
jgi:hypothetical protein